MPHNKQAKKRLRQDVGRRHRNKSRNTAMKNQVKSATEVIQSGDVPAAREALREAVKRIDLAAKKNVIHKNTAARRKSALSRRLRDLDQGGATS
ncbi:MAG: 30S ribosomal protein S20 [Planctomycetota bacterium]